MPKQDDGAKMTLRFVTEEEIAKLKGLDVNVMRAEVAKLAAPHLSPEQIEALRVLEPAVLRWMRADTKNAVLFAVDPLRALEVGGFVVDATLLEALKQLRESMHAAMQSVASVPRVASIKLEC